jgi:hypothetical protein
MIEIIETEVYNSISLNEIQNLENVTIIIIQKEIRHFTGRWRDYEF